MKAKNLLIMMALLSAISAFAYEQIGHLNPYAYGAKAAKVNDSIAAVSYNLNETADSSFVLVYKNNTVNSIVRVNDNQKGNHQVLVNIPSNGQNDSISFAIRVCGTSYNQPFQLKEIKDGSTDTTALCYAFCHPKGVDIDRDPFSEYFGRILTDECMQDTPDQGYHSSAASDKDGIYAFDATFQPITNGNNRAFKGGLEFAVRMANGTTRAYTPYRIRISKDGRIFVSMQDDTRSPLYEVSADLQTWTPIFNGTMNDGVMLDADGKYITGINCGMDVRGEGENLEIIMLNTNLSGMASYNGKGQMIATYKLGTATSWNGPATTADTLCNVVGAGVVPVIGNCGIAYDEDIDGYWYIGNRSDAIGQRALVHVNAAGEVDWALSENDSTLFSLNGNGLYGSGNARIQDGMLMIGTGQRVRGTGHLQIFDVTYSNNGNVPSLSKKWELDCIGISHNLNDFAIDHGHNLYTVGNSNEKIIPIALPYGGVIETPCNIGDPDIIQSGTCGPNLTWTLNSIGVLKISGTGNMDNYDRILHAPWYDFRFDFSTVIINDSVNSIGNYAFSGCERLTSVTIPNSVTSVGDGAFTDCNAITSPIYNSHVFAYMPDSYSGTYTIPSGIESIAGYAFSGCSGLTSITIPNSVTSIGNGAFRGCSGLTSITIPNSVTSIGNYAFFDCSGLTSVTIPTSVTSIGVGAFCNCSGLTSVNIPNSVTSIGEYAFSGCSGLTSVTIPNSVTSIGGSAFGWCSELDTVYFESATPPQLGDWAFENTPSSLKIIVPCGAIDAYRRGDGHWYAYYSQIQSLPSAAIQTAPLVEGTGQVNVPQYICDTILEAIPAYGYHFVQWTDSVTDNPRIIDSEVEATYIAEFALDKHGRCGDDLLLRWAYDSESQTLTISGNGTFNSNIYYGIEAPAEMTSLVIEDSVQSIGAYAFYGISSLTSVTLGQDVSIIRENAFYNCENLSIIRNYRPTPANVYSTSFDGVDKFTCTLYVPEGSVTMYSAATGWRDFFNIVGFNPTGYEDLSEEASSIRKVFIDGHLYILHPDGTRYDATGKKVE